MTIRLPILISVIFSLFINFPSYIHATNHVEIQGRIVDEHSQAPISGAIIQSISHESMAFSDEQGYFSIALSSMPDSLVISAIGYNRTYIPTSGISAQWMIALQPRSLELEQVIISAPNLNDFHTLSKIDVNLRPASSGQDLLRIVPGLFIAQHAGGGKAEQIFLRGFDLDHGTDIQINVDGLPVNMVSHAHGQGYSDLHFLIPELVESVDFGKGPYYADYGNFTTAGYVDFHTRHALEKSTVKLELGQFNTQRMLAMVKLMDKEEENSQRNAYVATELLLTDGPFESPQNAVRLNVVGKYTEMIGTTQLLSVQASHMHKKWDHSGQIPERAVESGLISRFGAIDDTEGGETSRSNLNIQYIKALENRATFRSQFYISQYEFELYSNFTFFLEDPINGDQIQQKEHRTIIGSNTSYELPLEVGAGTLTSRIGAGFRYDDVNDISLARTKNRIEVLEPLALGQVNETNGYVYVDERYQWGNTLLNFGVRLDHFRFDYVDELLPTYDTQSESITRVSPKLSLFHNIHSDWQVYVKSGIGFHSNDARVVVAQSGEDILPAAYGLDIGTVYKPISNLILQSAVWILHLDQEFVYVGDAGIVEPSGRTRRLGVDISARYQLSKGIYADVDVSWNRGRALDESEGANYIPLAPVFSSMGGLSVETEWGISGSIRTRLLGDRPANEDFSLTAVGYTVTDARLNYTTSRFQVGLTVENVFNVDWREAQFETTSRLREEAEAVTEVHFTPGVPVNVRGSVSVFF